MFHKFELYYPRMKRAIRVMVSRHSAFYSPLIAVIAAGFLERESIEATYGVLQPGQRSHALLRAGAVDVFQSAVSSSWGPLEKGERDLPVHFAQINQRDGFFLVARRPIDDFEWEMLEAAALLADHGGQPLAMLKCAARCQGVDWDRIRMIDAGSPSEMERAFRDGSGDFVHLQGPAAQQLEAEAIGWIVASAGEAMPPVAFSSLLAKREFLQTDEAQAFLRVYRRAREWVDQAPAREVAAAEAHFFPGVSSNALGAAVARYQQLGCWDGGIEIPRALYDQALEVFLAAGTISRRYPYEEVVVTPCIE
jgi:NitT/TauT family transport system substrate-binding protein